jgi:hypothetical protein
MKLDHFCVKVEVSLEDIVHIMNLKINIWTLNLLFKSKNWYLKFENYYLKFWNIYYNLKLDIWI